MKIHRTLPCVLSMVAGMLASALLARSQIPAALLLDLDEEYRSRRAPTRLSRVQRFPRRSCSISRLSNSALKLPLPKICEPRRPSSVIDASPSSVRSEPLDARRVVVPVEVLSELAVRTAFGGRGCWPLGFRQPVRPQGHAAVRNEGSSCQVVSRVRTWVRPETRDPVDRNQNLRFRE